MTPSWSGDEPFDTPASTAWSMVLDALEGAIDVDELPAADRGALAQLHEHAGRQLGIAPLTLTPASAGGPDSDEPGPDSFATVMRRLHGLDGIEIPDGPDGLNQLWLDRDTLLELVAGGLDTVTAVERASDAELADAGCGVKRVKRIRKAIGAHRNPSAKAAAQGPGGISELGNAISAPTWVKLYRLGLPLIADVERADRAGELATAEGIGPRVLESIRTALARHREWASLVAAASATNDT